jgi:hypothetical protein
MSQDTCEHGNVVYHTGDCEQCEAEERATEEAVARSATSEVEADQIRAEQWFAENEQPAWMGDFDDIYGGGYSEM